MMFILTNGISCYNRHVYFSPEKAAATSLLIKTSKAKFLPNSSQGVL